jgi:hypothetical protein
MVNAREVIEALGDDFWDRLGAYGIYAYHRQVQIVTNDVSVVITKTNDGNYIVYVGTKMGLAVAEGLQLCELRPVILGKLGL